MDSHYFDNDSGINDYASGGDNKGDDGRPMLSYVISLLRAAIGILDIISGNLGKHK